MESAFLLAGAGEFAFVVLTLSRDVGLLQPAERQFFMTVAALSMLSVPALAWIGRRLAEPLARRSEASRHGVGGGAADLADHVVIGGFGRVGRMVAEILDAERIPYVALDLDANVVRAERAAGGRSSTATPAGGRSSTASAAPTRARS